MPTPQFVIRTVIAFALGAGVVSAGHAQGVPAATRTDLENVSRMRIYFGHQSVGTNLLEGVAELAAQAGVKVDIVNMQSANGLGKPAIGHTFIAENGRPYEKLQAFAQAMGTQAANVDVALVKLCYLDFTATTDAAALFSRYQAVMAELRARHPKTTFVHVTVPLTTIAGGAKEWAKRMLGKAPYGMLENMRREEYNALLRKAYQGREPVFDLARTESTAPDGKTATAEWKGSTVPVLAAVYTHDGGHLNDEGKRRAAGALLSVLGGIR